eukprot:m.838224 g.838224  ORF g.838224 m.838224 type:complete len:1257 (-) comp59497_c0_seq2:178-3948(-)
MSVKRPREEEDHPSLPAPTPQAAAYGHSAPLPASTQLRIQPHPSARSEDNGPAAPPVTALPTVPSVPIPAPATAQASLGPFTPSPQLPAPTQVAQQTSFQIHAQVHSNPQPNIATSSTTITATMSAPSNFVPAVPLSSGPSTGATTATSSPAPNHPIPPTTAPPPGGALPVSLTNIAGNSNPSSVMALPASVIQGIGASVPSTGAVTAVAHNIAAQAQALPLISQPHAPQTITTTTTPSQISQPYPHQLQPPVHDENYTARLKVEDALSYLDEVKRQFGHQPQVYNKFLDIMKEFKSQHINTPGVIAAVSELFKGHPALINGFNTFLPAGYKIEMHENGIDIMVSQPGLPPRTTSVALYAMENRQPTAAEVQQNEARKSPVAFNHAISYVNKIKSRFADVPDTYKSFLEILHTYQKEQRGIKEVYAHVAKLFHAHPDLLEEFSQFLPDTEADEAPATAPPSQTVMKKKPGNGMVSSAMNKTVKRTTKDALSTPSYANYGERIFFEKVKRALHNRSTYEDFLRCLQLYNLDIVNVGELVQLVSMFLSKFPDLMKRFKEFVGYQEVQFNSDKSDLIVHDSYADTAAGSNSAKITHSYQVAPPEYQRQKCTGRTPLGSSVLNDEFISIPSFAEEPQFVAVKKNQYEETLFRIEDERFELDSLLETNLATIRALEAAVREFSGKSTDEQAKFKFHPKNLIGTSETIYRVCIKRLYGERGDDVLQAVARDPINNIPLVLKRLKQKHVEWRRAQKQWNLIWREGFEKNYLKSLDVKGPGFKKTDTLQYRPRTLKEKFEQAAEDLKAYRNRARVAGVAAATPADDVPVPSPLLHAAALDDDTVLQDVARLIMYQAKRIVASPDDRDKMEHVLVKFLPRLYGIFSNHTAATQALFEQIAAEEQARETEAGEAPLSRLAPVMPRIAHAASTTDGDTTSVFFANDTWATFVTLFAVLYERVCEVKQLSDAIRDQLKTKKKPANAPEIPCALGLSLIVPLDIAKDKYYEAFLDLVEKLLDNQVDAYAFEDTLREMYNNKAYKLCTIDKIIQSTTKQLGTVVGDPQCIGLLGLHLNSVSSLPEPAYLEKAQTFIEGIAYRINAKAHRQITVELVDATLQASKPATYSPQLDAYAEYVRRYGSADVTDDTLATRTRPSFLKRNVNSAPQHAEGSQLKDFFLDNMLACNISAKDYKLHFVANSRDFMVRHRSQPRRAAVSADDKEAGLARLIAKMPGAERSVDEETAFRAWLAGTSGAEQPSAGTTVSSA